MRKFILYVTVLIHRPFFSTFLVDVQSDPNTLADLEADVTEECVKLGPLERLKVKRISLS